MWLKIKDIDFFHSVQIGMNSRCLTPAIQIIIELGNNVMIKLFEFEEPAAKRKGGGGVLKNKSRISYGNFLPWYYLLLQK